MLSSCGGLDSLLMEQLLDGLLPGHLLRQGLMWSFRLWELCLKAELRAFLFESVLKDWHCEGLVHSYATCSTLVATAVGCPSV